MIASNCPLNIMMYWHSGLSYKSEWHEHKMEQTRSENLLRPFRTELHTKRGICVLAKQALNHECSIIDDASNSSFFYMSW